MDDFATERRQQLREDGLEALAVVWPQECPTRGDVRAVIANEDAT